jgi:hypothetical protein
MGDHPDVDVLIVSLCAAERAAAIRRAIDTALSQEGVRACVTIVVNGQRFDRKMFEALKRQRGVRVLYQREPSIFLARRYAREEVHAPFFGFLDDDDQLLPGALATRVRALVSDAEADVVVTDGLLSDGMSESLILGDVTAIRQDPLHSLLASNWLATASALFRTESIPPDYFDATIRSNDMTYLAFRLALEKRVTFVAVPTYRKTYSPDSISLTPSWALPSLDTLDKMLTFPMPASVRRGIRRKCAAAAHDISNIYRERGEAAPAWRYHLRSLREPGGLLRYALYTRHLFGIRRGMRP